MALLFVTSSFAYAGSVHKWVDDNGVTHYSDQAPENHTKQIDQLEVNDSYQASNIEDDYYSVSKQWERMHAERVERKKLQLEKAKLRQAKREASSRVVTVDNEVRRDVYYPIYTHGLWNRGYRGVNGYRNRFNHFNAGSRYKLPRNNYSRSGLTLTIR